MLAKVIATVKHTIVSRTRTIMKTIERIVRPAGAVAAAAAGIARDATRSRRELVAENAFLRQQLIVLRRSVKRPTLGRAHRLLLVVLTRCTRTWRDALHLVQPQTLLRWHRDLFRIVWKRKSRPQPSSCARQHHGARAQCT